MLSCFGEIKTDAVKKGDFSETTAFFFAIRAWNIAFEMAYESCEMTYEYFMENMTENHEIQQQILDFSQL